MAITLGETEVSAKTVLDGFDEVDLGAGKSLTIETSPSGEEILDETVPIGKTWHVYLSISIIETDA